MAAIISLEQVESVRKRIANAHALAAERFRAVFELSELPVHERWRTHLEIQAAALIDAASHVRLRGGITYAIEGRIVEPYVDGGQPLYGSFDVDRTPEAIFEYWMLISEITAAPSWNVTRVIATPEEFDSALRGMVHPQMVRALVVDFLPDLEWRDDGTAMLEVSLYTRAGEERIERRTLVLDLANEFHFHSREIIAEGAGGVEV